MGRAEFGTPKYVANQMKAKGLQRLRWYCQVCEKQCRDENGFKCHTQSESHLRNMLHVSENAQKNINKYSEQFKNDFLNLLRTSHGDKPINANRFYQEYIQKKSHIHMNATRWVTLSQFVKYLGREGICKVTESEKEGLCVAWIDRSRQETAGATREKKPDSEIEMRLMERQIDSAKQALRGRAAGNQEQADGSTTTTTTTTTDAAVPESEFPDTSLSTPLSLSLNKPSSITNATTTTTNTTTTATTNKPKRPATALFADTSASKITKQSTAKDNKSKPLNAFQKLMLKETTRRSNK